jgi:transposase InsO family protein
MKWSYFLKKKSEVGKKLAPLLLQLETSDRKSSFIRCDNASENTKQLQEMCTESGAQIEFTAPNTPQQNGVVERAFVT